MLQDLIRIKPQAQSNYHTQWYEMATPVQNPKAKAQHYFQWALIHHARKKPAEAYKYYEKAIIHHRNPLYIKQMALLHHEMGYFSDALKYLRTAFDLEQAALKKKQKQMKEQKKQAVTSTLGGSMAYTEDDTWDINRFYRQDHTFASEEDALSAEGKSKE